MGPRNLLILFFSAVAVSLVILIILSSLVFKNLSLDFNTHLPESTPDIGRQFSNGPSMNPDSKADSVTRATVNVPPESVDPTTAPDKKDKADTPVMDSAPMSDDSVLENNAPLPLGDTVGTEATPVPSAINSTAEKTSGKTAAPAPRTPRPSAERPANPAPVAPLAPAGDAIDSQSSGGPPVPGQ